MSFILDALKKSENERQQQAPAEFAIVPGNPETAAAPRWLWILGALLLVNVVVVVALMMRGEPQPPTPAVIGASESAARPATVPGTPAAVPASDDFADRLEKARHSLPDRGVPDTAASAPDTAGIDSAGVQQSTTTPSSSTASSIAFLPSLDELRLNGELQLPELHIDLHVFDPVPRDRFVSINMEKYRERDTMREGPVVTEITPDGVVLEYSGRRFVLSRE